jgi:hypothetical protein
MPVYESACDNRDCEARGHRVEWFAWRMNAADPPCGFCEIPMRRMISNFNAPFTGELSRFDTPHERGANEVDGGHIVQRVRSSRLVDGAPESVLIRTRQDQRAFCKAEGLLMPDELNPHIQATEDGFHENTRGLPGSWTAPSSDMEQNVGPVKERPVMAGAW